MRKVRKLVVECAIDGCSGRPRVLARVKGARYVAIDTNGDVYVTATGENAISRILN